MSEQTQQPIQFTVPPEVQFDVQLRAASLEQAIRTAEKAHIPITPERITQAAAVFLHFLRTGIAINSDTQGE